MGYHNASPHTQKRKSLPFTAQWLKGCSITYTSLFIVELWKFFRIFLEWGWGGESKTLGQNTVYFICVNGLFSDRWPSGGWPTFTSNNYWYFPSICLPICFLHVWNIKEMDSQRFFCYPFAFFFNWIKCSQKQPFLHTRFVRIASVGIDRRLYFSFKHTKLPICW